MVNRQKHDKRKIAMQVNVDDIENITVNSIAILNEHPQETLDLLQDWYDEYEQYFALIQQKRGKVLNIGACRRILHIFERVYILRDVIHFNYELLTLETDMLKAHIEKCENILALYDDIQARQNKNIDNKQYGGLDSVRWTEALANPHPQYFDDVYERIIRLEKPIETKGVRAFTPNDKARR